MMDQKTWSWKRKSAEKTITASHEQKNSPRGNREQFQQSAMMQPGGGHYLQQHQQAHQMTPQALMAARSSMLYSQQPYSSLQQQVLHNQLGMSSGGSSGLHMLHGESGGSGSLGGGFPDFGRGVVISSRNLNLKVFS